MTMTLEQIWNELQPYEGEGSKKFSLPGIRVQFYKGAMEIPMIAFSPSSPLNLEKASLEEYARLLSSYGFVLDCVTE